MGFAAMKASSVVMEEIPIWCGTSPFFGRQHEDVMVTRRGTLALLG
jgi:hypothetical protein